MRAQRIACTVLIASLTMAVTTAWAQTARSGTIAGAVTDSTGGVMPGVTVEAGSAALIEKVRAAVTDGQGQYSLVDLRPGTYTVTFTLPGFTTVRREGLVLNAGVTLTVDAALRVGELQETVTVTGATPVVDVQGVRSQTVLTNDTLNALPTAKGNRAYATLTLGATLNAGLQDVGGNQGESYSNFVVHGGHLFDGRIVQEGMPIQTVEAGSGARRNRINEMAVQETTIEISGMSAESETGGVQTNIIPKEGGNTTVFSINMAYTNGDLQSENITDDLRARGVLTPPNIKKIYDYGVGVGGPIQKDKLWFYTAHRWWGAQNTVSGNYYNRNPNSLFYTADLSRPAYTDYFNRDHTLRLTWQAAAKHKINLSHSVQYNCGCNFLVDQNRSPEAAIHQTFVPIYLTQATWSYPATSRLLLEAGATYLRGDQDVRRLDGVSMNAIPVTDLATGYSWGAATGQLGVTSAYGHSWQYLPAQRFAVSYIPGSHVLKFGFTVAEVWRDNETVMNSPPIAYTFLNGAPNAITQYASPHYQEIRVIPNLGVYAQDRWTLKKLTINAGVRFDHLKAYIPAGTRPQGAFVPAFDYGRIDDVPNWKDISPRLGAAYDLFGNGKTALKVSLGRYVENQTYEIANANHPANTIVTNVRRTWSDANGDFVPDCDLRNPGVNGECGGISDPRFGQTNITTRYSPDVLSGFGVRSYDWQVAASIQHELRPGIGLTAGYHNTRWANFTLTDNLAVTPADYNTFCVTTPRDARLPGGGGDQICGLYDVSREKFGRIDNLIIQASQFGKYSDVYHGVDIGVDARLGHGARISGGFSTGQSVVDKCVVVDSPQLRFCRVTTPWDAQTQFKFSGVYPLPWNFQASAVLQNLAGVPILANRAFPNAEVAPSLGRNLSNCPSATGACVSTVSVDLIEPNTQFEKRLNQVDIRLARVFRLGGSRRVQANIDAYNVFNANTILTRNNTFGPTWGRPTAVLGARLLKFGFQLDF